MKCTECDREAHSRGLCGMHYKRLTSKRPVSPTRDMTTEERFFHYVNKRPGECWPWTGSTFGEGRYGAFWVSPKTISAHVYSYILHRGPVPSGMFVCHSCDNPKCVNPDHLFLATPKENTRDMLKKGRHWTPSGDLNPRTKIKDAEIPKIFEMSKFMTHGAIAATFGVSRPCISMILSGRKRATSCKPCTGDS